LVICHVGATSTGSPPSVFNGTGPLARPVEVDAEPRGVGAAGVETGDDAANDPIVALAEADAVGDDDSDGDDRDDDSRPAGPAIDAAPAGADDAHAGSARAMATTPVARIRRLLCTAATLRREPVNADEGPPVRASPRRMGSVKPCRRVSAGLVLKEAG
jgi:hypothetical protein